MVEKALEGAGAVKARESWRVARKQLLRAMEGAAMFVRSLAGLWFAIRMNGPKMAFVAMACDQPWEVQTVVGVGGALRPLPLLPNSESLSTSAMSYSLLVNINIDMI